MYYLTCNNKIVKDDIETREEAEILAYELEIECDGEVRVCEHY